MKLNQRLNSIKNTAIVAVMAATLFTGGQPQKVELKPTFRDNVDAKNIAFSANLGGASHINWVLAIGDELIKRNHNVTFLTLSDHVKFGRNFPSVQTISMGSSPLFDRPKKVLKVKPEQMVNFWAFALSFFNKHFEKDYQDVYNYFIENKIDVALCDHFADYCVDAAKTAGIPFIITAAFEITPESSASYINNNILTMYDTTTEFESFSTRFKNKLIRPFQHDLRHRALNKELNRKRAALGIKPSYGRYDVSWKHSLKIANTIFGFSAPRAFGPLAELVGPIIPPTYDALTPELTEFMNSHPRVAYIAFGQHATATESDIIKILSGVLECVEQGSLDGFLWATVMSSGKFPETITTASNTTYLVQDMVDQTHPFARLVKWAPQTAVLMHPSAHLFVSHGGLGSWYESMYAGVPMIMYPFFGDQPGNALIIEREGLGLVLKEEYTHEQVVGLFKRVSSDVDGSFKQNCKRYQALVQIHSQRGVAHGADLVEEVAYTHVNGILPHREVAANRMSFVKAHNLDLYAAAGVLVLMAAGIVLTGVNFAIAKFVANEDIKLKKL